MGVEGKRRAKRFAPRTIGGRIAAATFVLLALVLAFAAVAIDLEVREGAEHALDRQLASEAQALAALTRFDGRRVELGFEDETMTAFQPSRHGERAYFEVW